MTDDATGGFCTFLDNEIAVPADGTTFQVLYFGGWDLIASSDSSVCPCH